MDEPLSSEWSTYAVFQLEKYYQFILEEWLFRDAEKFLDQVQEFEMTIALFPNSFV